MQLEKFRMKFTLNFRSNTLKKLML